MVVITQADCGLTLMRNTANKIGVLLVTQTNERGIQELVPFALWA